MANEYYEDEIEYFKHIGHELAHLWWRNGIHDSWEDWLNESFAEYSALLAIRVVYGEDKFNEFIDMYKKETKDFAPIKNIDRSASNAHALLYKKGPVIVSELEKQVGMEAFQKLLGEVYSRKVDHTELLYEVISEAINDKAKEMLDKFLNT